VEEGLRRYPDRADLVYTRACLRAASGDHDAALEDLRRAIELHPEIRDWARDEAALEPIRDRL
jgi:tetratricopeptide (TPR) repeat protein